MTALSGPSEAMMKARAPAVAARTAAGDGKEQIVKVECNSDPTLHYNVNLWGRVSIIS